MKRITVHDKTTLPVGQSIGGLVKNKTSIPEPSVESNPKASSRPSPYIIEEATLNGHLILPAPRKDLLPIPIDLLPCSYSVPRRYLHTRPSDKSEALNAQIDRYASQAAAALGLAMGDFGHPGISTPASVTVVGRIVGESEGPLSNSSIFLESSRQMGSGCRVPLVLKDTACALFPGQIAILEGSNPDGTAFHVVQQKRVSFLRSLNL